MTSDFEREVIEGLTELKTQMKLLVGNGQPGFIQLIDGRVDALEQERATRAGERRGRKDIWAFALSGVAALGELIHLLLPRH